MTDQPPRRTRSERLPFLVGTIVLLVGVSITVATMLKRTGGRFVYPMDDTYIHLVMARNLGLHGTWGVVPGHFESASSSPLWTALLAVPEVVLRGRFEWAYPIAVALFASVWALWSAAKLLADCRPIVATIVSVATAFVLVPITSIGMEHALHIALIVATLGPFLALLDGTDRRSDQMVLAIALPLATWTRLETVFVLVGMGVVLVWFDTSRSRTALVAQLRRRARAIVLITAPSILAILALAVWNRAMGQGWMPNSVLSKSAYAGRFPIIDALASPMTMRRLDSVALITVATLVALIAVRPFRRRTIRSTLPLLTFVATASQAVFTVWTDQNVYFFRYHAYLFILTFIAVGLAWNTEQETSSVSLRHLVPSLACVLLLVVSFAQLSRIPYDAWEEDHQQMQTAAFFARHAPDVAIAINDLGAVALEHRGPIVDLAGLGSWQVISRMHGEPLGPAAIEAVTRSAGVQIAALFPSWFHGGLPEGWVPLEEWCLDLSHTDLVGNRCVLFLATDSSHAAHWRKALASFHDELPVGVVVRSAPVP